jgi:hypothetical protein
MILKHTRSHARVFSILREVSSQIPQKLSHEKIRVNPRVPETSSWPVHCFRSPAVRRPLDISFQHIAKNSIVSVNSRKVEKLSISRCIVQFASFEGYQVTFTLGVQKAATISSSSFHLTSGPPYVEHQQNDLFQLYL